jgi:hypothetical protein
VLVMGFTPLRGVQPILRVGVCGAVIGGLFMGKIEFRFLDLFVPVKVKRRGKSDVCSQSNCRERNVLCQGE